MSEQEPRIDRDASKAIKRIESQMRMEGKLDKADAAEGAGMLFLPVAVIVMGGLGWFYKSLGLEGPAMAGAAVASIIGLGLFGLYLADKK